jgi:hypothetical protein
MNPRSGRANRRILIVDDTTSIHEDYRKILCADATGSQSLDSIEETLFGTAPSVRQTFVLDSAYQGQEALALVKKALADNALCPGVHRHAHAAGLGWPGNHRTVVERRSEPADCPVHGLFDYSWEAIEARWSSATSC